MNPEIGRLGPDRSRLGALERHQGWQICSLACCALQAVNSHNDGRLFENLDQPIEQAFIVVRSGLKVFFKNALSIADGLNGQFLIAHSNTSMQ